jgi:hypothetical protein
MAICRLADPHLSRDGIDEHSRVDLNWYLAAFRLLCLPGQMELVGLELLLFATVKGKGLVPVPAGSPTRAAVSHH